MASSTLGSFTILPSWTAADSRWTLLLPFSKSILYKSFQERFNRRSRMEYAKLNSFYGRNSWTRNKKLFYALSSEDHKFSMSKEMRIWCWRNWFQIYSKLFSWVIELLSFCMNVFKFFLRLFDWSFYEIQLLESEVFVKNRNKLLGVVHLLRNTITNCFQIRTIEFLKILLFTFFHHSPPVYVRLLQFLKRI